MIAAILIHPVMGLVRVWAGKQLLATDEGSLGHGVAATVAVLA